MRLVHLGLEDEAAGFYAEDHKTVVATRQRFRVWRARHTEVDCGGAFGATFQGAGYIGRAGRTG